MPADALPIPHAEQLHRLGGRLRVADRDITVTWGPMTFRSLTVDSVATRTLSATVEG